MQVLLVCKLCCTFKRFCKVQTHVSYRRLLFESIAKYAVVENGALCPCILKDVSWRLVN